MDASNILNQVEMGLATEWGTWDLTITEWGDGVTTVEALQGDPTAPFAVVMETDLIYPMAPTLAKIRDDLDASEQNKAEAAFQAWLGRVFGG